MTNAQLAADLRELADGNMLIASSDRKALRLAAQRLEGKISEALIERVFRELCRRGYKISNFSIRITLEEGARASLAEALEAAREA